MAKGASKRLEGRTSLIFACLACLVCYWYYFFHRSHDVHETARAFDASADPSEALNAASSARTSCMFLYDRYGADLPTDCSDVSAPVYFDPTRRPFVFPIPFCTKRNFTTGRPQCEANVDTEQRARRGQVQLTGFPKSGTTFIHFSLYETMLHHNGVHFHLSPTYFHQLLFCLQYPTKLELLESASGSRQPVKRTPGNDRTYWGNGNMWKKQLQSVPSFSHYHLVDIQRVHDTNLRLLIENYYANCTDSQTAGNRTADCFAACSEENASGKKCTFSHVAARSGLNMKRLQNGQTVIVVRELFATVNSALTYFNQTKVTPFVVQYIEYYLHIFAALSHPELKGRVRVVRYEDFVRNPRKGLRVILDFLGERQVSDASIASGVQWSTRHVMAEMERRIPISFDCGVNRRSQSPKVMQSLSARNSTVAPAPSTYKTWRRICRTLKSFYEGVSGLKFLSDISSVFGYAYTADLFKHCEDDFPPDGWRAVQTVNNPYVLEV